jgi:hypothetical protein
MKFAVHQSNGALRFVVNSSYSLEYAEDVWGSRGYMIAALPFDLTLALDHYRVVDGQVVERPAPPVEISAPSFAADGVAECVLSGLPDPCTVTLTGAVSAGPLEVTGGSLTLTSTTPGAIAIRITADPVWKPWEATIHAT